VLKTGKKKQMQDWIKYLAGPEVDNMCFFHELGDEYEATGLMQNPAVNVDWAFTPNPAPNTREEARDLYATSGLFFNMISINLMNLPNVHMFVFNESAKHNGAWPLCHDPHGAHACEISFVLSEPGTYNTNSERGTENIAGGENLNTAIQTTMRAVWNTFANYGTPGWGSDEVGVFTDGGNLEARAAAFDPNINLMFEQLMCAPETISEPCGSGVEKTYECGEIKELYRDNGCCGMPTKTFEFPARRLSAVPANAMTAGHAMSAGRATPGGRAVAVGDAMTSGHEMTAGHAKTEPSRILRSIDLALKDAKIKGGATRAHRLANLIGEALADS